MKKNILYGVNGEGLGHISRSACIIEGLLKDNYNVTLAGAVKNPDIGNDFIHTDFIDLKMSGSKINTAALITDYIKFFIKIKKRIQLFDTIKRPDIVISDFEPLTAYYARRHKIPLLSLDSQHRFEITPRRILNYKMRAIHVIMKLINKLFIGNVDHSIITCFHPHEAKGKSSYSNIINTKEDYPSFVQPDKNSFILCYLRKSIIPEIEYLNKEHTIVYANDLPKEEFLNLLRKSDGVITHAGNQLLGECVYYGKPITCIPIESQIEQYANSYYLELYKLGKSYYDTKNITINKKPPTLKTRNGYFPIYSELHQWMKTI